MVASNIHARHLYERLGFTQLGTIPGGFRMKDGQRARMEREKMPKAACGYLKKIAEQLGIIISTTILVCGTLLSYKTTTTEVIYNNDSYN